MNSSPLSDSELIPRLLAKEEAAFFIVVEAYQSILLQVSRSIVGDSIAEEVVQEAWIAAFRALPKFERRSTLKTWLVKITSNCAKSRLRHESRTTSFSELGGANDGEPLLDPANFSQQGRWENPPASWDINSPDAILSSDQLMSCLNSALDVLPQVQRAVLTLRDMQNLDMDSICKVLELSESNARVLLHRARSQVREFIDQCQRK